MKLTLSDEHATEAFGATLADCLPDQCTVYLSGELGAGKTTLARGILRAIGYVGNVKSPTYAMVEPYEVNGRQVFHFDLYRLADPEELEYMGIRDYFQQQAIRLIEWPEKAGSHLGKADLHIRLSYADTQRVADLEAITKAGQCVCDAMAEKMSGIQD